MYMQNVCISVYMTACLGVYVCVYIYEESERERERENKQYRFVFLFWFTHWTILSVSFSITRKPLVVEIEVIQRSE